METLAALLPSGMEPWVAALLIVASSFTSAITAAFGIGGGIAMLALIFFIRLITRPAVE